MHESTLSVPEDALEAAGFEEFERSILEHAHAIARELAAAALRRMDDDLAARPPGGLRVKDRRVRRVLTRFGEVEIVRRRWAGPSGESRYLLDERLSLPARSRMSPCLERSLLTLSASVSFREAAGIIGALTSAGVSHMTAHAGVARAGERLAAETRAQAADLHDLGLSPKGERCADPLYCEADGTVICLQGARRRRGEVKLAIFYDDKRDGARAVHAAFLGARPFWREASAVAGGVYDLAHPHATILSGDGASWVRGGAEVLPGARFVLDPFHISKALLAATGSYAAARKAGSLLYGQGLDACLLALRRLAAGAPERAEAIERVCGYLTANSDGLWRPAPSLGSIEGHIDKVLAARFKKRGRRWSPHGADAMARVLAAARSKRPFPVGMWSAPLPREVARPLPAAPFSSDGAAARAYRPPQAGIVSNRTAEGFTRILRDISGTRRSD